MWNVVLLISFLISAGLGLALTVALDQKLLLGWYRGALWWHVEMGIVMAIISIFHMVWHGRYYLNILKTRNIFQ